MRRTVWTIVAVVLVSQTAMAQDCSRSPYCTEMRSCAEADFYFRQCGDAARDGDSDGIPCEALCGDTMALYLERRGSGTAGPSLFAAPQEAETISCGSKRTCRQMTSCAEATAYLRQCGVASLDRDGDGRPCESLCR